MTARHRTAGTARAARPSALRRPAALLGVLAIVAVGVVAGLPVPAEAVSDGADAAAFTMTKTLTRAHVGPDGADQPVDERTVTVSVDHTSNLQGRERVQVRWSGARPTAGRYSDPYGVNGLYQEYPVLVLQCRGVENPGPGQQQLSRETCWTTVAAQRFGQQRNAQAAWMHDRYASAADNAPQSQDKDWPDACIRLPDSMFVQHRLPFRAASGKVYDFCSEETQAPESAVDSAFPPAEIAAVTKTDGTGSVAFEVRTKTENESLGCADDVACSLVVIPIMGLSCGDGDAACRAAGINKPGELQPNYGAADLSVTAALWWSESNWRNRFVVPLSFALPPNACDVLDPRAPVGFYGSELMAQASLQWAPAYCLRADRFKYQHNVQPETTGLAQLASNTAPGAFTTRPATSKTPPLAYAPTAVTGWGVAFVSDLPENAGELDEMRLTPRLLAKLLTESYPGSFVGATRPGLEKNPLSINLDPEFQELNPGLSTTANEAMATLTIIPGPSDTLYALTSYIAQDAAAMAFIHGEADEHGMKVNPEYQDVGLPAASLPQLDTFYPTFQPGDCRADNYSQPYLNLISTTAQSLRKVSDAVVDAWPLVATRCEAVPNQPVKKGRVVRQSYGGRNMLGLVSLGDAARYGLRLASLRTAGSGASATFVAPTDASLAAAVAESAQTSPGAPFLLDSAHLSAAAYPGTMVVHTAARISGLPKEDAQTVVEFIQTATTEGQIQGNLNGQLPRGYLPIVDSGPTKPLYDSAQLVAAAVLRQDGTVTVAPTPTPSPTPTPTPSATPPAAPVSRPLVPSAAPGGTGVLPGTGAEQPTEVPGLPAEEPADGPQVAAPVQTAALTSTAADAALPVALSVSLAGAFAAPLLRLWSTRGGRP